MPDVFICHASEDKEAVARPLADGLSAAGLAVWYDEFSLQLGDSLRESIDKGLADSRFGVVILSASFFSKKWPQAELNGLFSKEILGDKTIVPVWHGITQAEIAKHSPMLADRVAVPTSVGLDKVLERVLEVIQPSWRHKVDRGHTLALSPTSVRLHSGEWAVRTEVSIVNRSNDPIYAAMLKILISGEGVMSNSLKIQTDEQVPPIEEVLGDGFIVSADQLLLHCNDGEGRQVALFVFHTIPPRGSRTLSIAGTTPTDSTAEISIVSFEDKPTELLKKDGRQIAVAFKTPEHGLTLRSVAWRMRRS